MSRPLVVTDCDEVLLHMVRHFGEWLGEAHDIELTLAGNPFETMRRRGGEPLSDADQWAYLGLFFDTEMARQTAIEGAASARNRSARAVSDRIQASAPRATPDASSSDFSKLLRIVSHPLSR